VPKKKARKTQNRKHPGVVLTRSKTSSGKIRWRARWTNPRTEKVVWRDMSKEDATNAKERTAWAVEKSAAMRRLRDKIEAEEGPFTETTVKDAVKEYFVRRAPELKARTIEVYTAASTELLAWAKESGPAIVEDLTRANLAELRAAVVGRPALRKRKGGKRGAMRATKKTRKPGSVNVTLRALRTILYEWREWERLPKIDREKIAKGLKNVKDKRSAPKFLGASDLRRLLDAARRHDAETFALTREEKDGERVPGTTARHNAVAPLILTVVLGGFRYGEASELPWSEVHLDEGAIVLDSERVKTGVGRRVDLSVSPALRSLLAGLKIRAGKEPRVFPWATRAATETARRRLAKYGAPKGWTWQSLRASCGTFLTCAPSIYGAASAFLSAKRLGHSVAVAEARYVGAVTTIPADAKTIEAAMKIEDHVARVVEAVAGHEPAEAVASA
jgi:integrase